MSLWLMLFILLANGIGVFGLKMLAVWQLPQSVKFPYLAFWYGAGLFTLGVPLLRRGFRLSRKEVGLGAWMALGSVIAQVAMATALDKGVPGSVVFPVSTGGSLVLVGVADRLFFGERMNWLSLSGVALGLLAVILLGVS